VKSLILSADVNSNISDEQRLCALQIIRKIIENANDNVNVRAKGAAEWDSSEWEMYRT